MKWNRFTIKTKTEAEDMIICTLAEIGVEGVEIQDHQPLTEEDKAAFKEALAPMYEKYKGEFGEDVFTMAEKYEQ